MRLFTLILTAIISLPASAKQLDLSGAWQQGGLITGQAPIGSTVTINGTETPVGADGRFVFGLERHFPAEAHVKAATKEGVWLEQTLLITPREYNTQYVEGVKKKHVTPPEDKLPQIIREKEQIISARGQFSKNLIPDIRFSWPVKDRITSVYGSRRFYNGEERTWHKGVDIAAPTGTPIKAPADGVVALALPMSYFNGNLVILDHGHQLFTVYAHMNSLKVKTGDPIKEGAVLGTVGNTGRSTGPHLHWGFYWRNIALDPQLFMKE